MPDDLPPPLPPNPPPLPKPRSRRFLWGILVACTVILAASALSFWLWSRDDPPPDVSDLVFSPLQLPDDQNAYAVLAKATQRVPPHQWTDQEEDTLQAMLNGSTWDDTIAQTCLRQVDPALPLLCQADRLPRGQTPWVSSPSDRLPNLSPIRKLCQMAQIRARAQTRSGHADDALRTALITLSAGHHVEESRGTIIHYLTGISIKTSSLGTIHDLVADGGASDKMLRSALRSVATSRASKTSLTLAFGSELRVFDSALLIMKNEGRESMLNDSPRQWLRPLARLPLLFKVNRTKQIYADFLRASSAMIDQPLAALQSNEELNDFISKQVKAKPFDPDNSIGRIFLSIITPTTPGILKARLHDQSRISATEAFLALTLYKRDHHELPASLDALVPDYLPAVPRDYFDGRPIRYSRDLGVVWSTGQKNLVIIRPDQTVEKNEIVLHLTPRKAPDHDAPPSS